MRSGNLKITMLRAGGVIRTWALVALFGAAACGGCSSVFPTALPGGFVWSENSRIEKKAKADSFPSPADVGLAEPTSTP